MIKKRLIIAIFAISVIPLIAAASVSDGTIDPAAKYAWGENIGWVNFRPDQGNVRVTDAGLTGFAWSANYGWINLNPSQGGVLNDAEGKLSGFAWGASIGWIDFGHVLISSPGKFIGYATSAISGKITFDCDTCNVRTDWRPRSERPQNGAGAGGGNSPSPAVSAEATRGEQSQNRQDNSVTITWLTNYVATSRVIYDLVSHASLGLPPNYGYTFSTVEDPAKVTFHTVPVAGLTPGTTYFYRTVSHASPDVLSPEQTFATTGTAPSGQFSPAGGQVATAPGAPQSVSTGTGGTLALTPPASAGPGPIISPVTPGAPSAAVPPAPTAPGGLTSFLPIATPGVAPPPASAEAGAVTPAPSLGATVASVLGSVNWAIILIVIIVIGALLFVGFRMKRGK